MIKNITKEMTDELNEKLKEEGCNFYFEFKEYLTDNSIGEIHPKLITEKFLYLASCDLNLEGFKFVKKFFKEKGIDEIQVTRSGGIIACQRDGKVY